MTQRTKTTDIFLISAGLFEVTIATAAGGQRRISQLWPGAITGEMSWLDGGPTRSLCTSSRRQRAPQ